MSWPTPYWSIGNVKFYVDEQSGDKPAVVGEQHVLDATNSTKHHSGSMGKSRRIAGTLVDTNGSHPVLNLLESYTESDTARTLTSDLGGEGDYIVMTVQHDRKQATNLSVPVYRVTVELKEA
jgi:uncharacterized protein affecting Mg2+/Co2+ transport